MCMFFMLNTSQGNQNYSINFFIKPSRLWKSLTADPCNSVRITPHPTGSYRPSPANTPRPYFTRVYGNRCKPFLLWASTGASIWRENPRIPAIICGWVAYFWPINSPCFVSVSLKVIPFMEVAVCSLRFIFQVDILRGLFLWVFFHPLPCQFLGSEFSYFDIIGLSMQ